MFITICTIMSIILILFISLEIFWTQFEARDIDIFKEILRKTCITRDFLHNGCKSKVDAIEFLRQVAEQNNLKISNIEFDNIYNNWFNTDNIISFRR